VRDDGKLVGMIDDRAICMAALTHELSLDRLLVNVAMAMDAFSVRADQDLEVAEALMAQHHVARLPVVDDDGRPLGMLALSDLAFESARADALIRDGLARAGRVLAAIAAQHHVR
jgi:CBS domain-containing protein